MGEETESFPKRAGHLPTGLKLKSTKGSLKSKRLLVSAWNVIFATNFVSTVITTTTV